MDEQTIRARGYSDPDLVRRRQVLAETLAALDTPEKRRRYHELAAGNLARWRTGSDPHPGGPRIQVVPGDWGAVTGSLTRQFGTCFAVLNMANAYVPGGAYLEGTAAQEENMFRRTDCHFSVGDQHHDSDTDRYRPEMTRLLLAADGTVYLDVDHPRVCLRDQEDRSQPDLGYAWLAEDMVFPFFELRAAAQDVRGGRPFDADEARRRIAAQLDTLRCHRIRHAVLSAFGCGAFQNPAPVVASLYREELHRRVDAFDVVAFAIYAPGYGPDNYGPFAATLAEPSG
jgi:hypothetical protein